MRVKSPGVPPGLANARSPGRAKLAKAPPPGLTMLANAPRLPGGGWAQVELTDALISFFFDLLINDMTIITVNRSIFFSNCRGQEPINTCSGAIHF